MNLDFLKFLGVPQRKVDLEVINDFIEDYGPKRINFASHHVNALRRTEGSDDVVGKLVLPFDEPFETIARSILSMDRVLFPSKFGNNYYRSIHSEEEYSRLESFIEKYKNIVFLRDTLDLSVALSMHESEPNVYTELGEHEFRLKYRSGVFDTKPDYNALLAELQKWLNELPYFKDANYICAVPSNSPFMSDLIKDLKGFGFINISDKVSWENKSGSLKNLKTAKDKIDMVQSWGLNISVDLNFKGKTILLVDDMYHSGVTMQYIAMRLKELGANRVFGLTLVKSLGN